MITPEYFQATAASLRETYVANLKAIVDMFPKYKAYPDFNTYSNSYNKGTRNLKKTQDALYALKAQVQLNTTEIDASMLVKNDEIITLTRKNKTLEEKLGTLKNDNYAAYGTLTDQHVLYNQLYYGNILFIALLFLIGGIYYKTNDNVSFADVLFSYKLFSLKFTS
jgi:hypothetical protein